MSKPVILVIDDDPMVLNAIERDMRKKYGRDYQITKVNLATVALDLLKQLQERHQVIALFLTDQRMPQMTGVQFLEQARAFYPEAPNVRRTASADTEAAIQSTNRAALDYYLMKPWDPPEEHLYPVIDDLLDEWKANVHLPYEGIRVAGTLWSPASHTVKDFLVRHQVPYQWLDVDTDPAARALVEAPMQGALTNPTV